MGNSHSVVEQLSREEREEHEYARLVEEAEVALQSSRYQNGTYRVLQTTASHHQVAIPSAFPACVPQESSSERLFDQAGYPMPVSHKHIPWRTRTSDELHAANDEWRHGAVVRAQEIPGENSGFSAQPNDVIVTDDSFNNTSAGGINRRVTAREGYHDVRGRSRTRDPRYASSSPIYTPQPTPRSQETDHDYNRIGCSTPVIVRVPSLRAPSLSSSVHSGQGAFSEREPIIIPPPPTASFCADRPSADDTTTPVAQPSRSCSRNGSRSSKVGSPSAERQERRSPSYSPSSSRAPSLPPRSSSSRRCPSPVLIRTRPSSPVQPPSQYCLRSRSSSPLGVYDEFARPRRMGAREYLPVVLPRPDEAATSSSIVTRMLAELPDAQGEVSIARPASQSSSPVAIAVPPALLDNNHRPFPETSSSSYSHTVPPPPEFSSLSPTAAAPRSCTPPGAVRRLPRSARRRSQGAEKHEALQSFFQNMSTPGTSNGRDEPKRDPPTYTDVSQSNTAELVHPAPCYPFPPAPPVYSSHSPSAVGLVQSAAQQTQDAELNGKLQDFFQNMLAPGRDDGSGEPMHDPPAYTDGAPWSTAKFAQGQALFSSATTIAGLDADARPPLQVMTAQADRPLFPSRRPVSPADDSLKNMLAASSVRYYRNTPNAMAHAESSNTSAGAKLAETPQATPGPPPPQTTPPPADPFQPYTSLVQAAGLPHHLKGDSGDGWQPAWRVFPLKVFRGSKYKILKIQARWDDEALLRELRGAYDELRTVWKKWFSLRNVASMTMVLSDHSIIHPQRVGPAKVSPSKNMRLWWLLHHPSYMKGCHEFMQVLTARTDLGVEFVERWQLSRIAIAIILPVAASVMIAVVYSIAVHDPSTAFTIAGYLTSAYSVCLVLVGLLNFVEY